jgi:hypothetical protein
LGMAEVNYQNLSGSAQMELWGLAFVGVPVRCSEVLLWDRQVEMTPNLLFRKDMYMCKTPVIYFHTML